MTGDLNAEQREFIEQPRSARSLVRIINDILDLTKIEAGNSRSKKNHFLCGHAWRIRSISLLPVAKGKGLDFNPHSGRRCAGYDGRRPDRLNQILTNLAGNAVKFTEKGKVEISVIAGGNTPWRQRVLTFTVTDTGIGIPEAKKDNLFREFSQVDDSHSRGYGGTGLGLAISKGIVERMGGKSPSRAQREKEAPLPSPSPLLRRKLGAGDVHEPGESDRSGWPPPRCRNRGKPRLLVAEDDPIIRTLLGLMLQRSNYESRHGREWA